MICEQTRGFQLRGNDEKPPEVAYPFDIDFESNRFTPYEIGQVSLQDKFKQLAIPLHA